MSGTAAGESALPSVLLVEDDDVVRERLAGAIEACPGLSLQAAVSTCSAARQALDEATPGVLLVDLGLPDGDGEELIREVRRRRWPTECMVVTVFGDEKHVVSAIEAGATGYLLKDSSPDEIGTAIVELLRGGSPISPAIARHLLKRFRVPDADSEEVPVLTARERDVLVYLVKGFTSPEIARFLGISAETVNSHVKHIYQKLAVHSRGEAVYEALQLGLVDRE